MEGIEEFLMEDASAGAGVDPGVGGYWWDFQVLSENVDLVGVSPNTDQDDESSLMLEYPIFQGSINDINTSTTAASSEQIEYPKFQGNTNAASSEQINKDQFQGNYNGGSSEQQQNELYPVSISTPEQEQRHQRCRDVEGSSAEQAAVEEILLLGEEDDFFFNGNEDEEEEEEEVESDDRKSSGSSSKNLISERNRRKRLNQQLFTLRSLVPNITKMDKRTILVDALAYLQGILQQTEALMNTFNFDYIEDNDITAGQASHDDHHHPVIDREDPPVVDIPQPQEYNIRPAIPTITQVDAEMLVADRFILKVTCNRAIGALGQVQKVIESLGLEITLVTVSELGLDYSLTTAFLRAKKKGVVTVEKLKHRVKVMAKKMRFHLWDA